MSAAASTAPAVATFTWSGADSATNVDWSDPANWVGGVAPSSDSTVAVEFPVLPCQVSHATDGNCGVSDNDLDDLTVTTFVTRAAGVAGDETPYQAYDIGGNAITLRTGYYSKLDATDGLSSYGLTVGMPITVSQKESWTLSGTQTVFVGGVTGTAPLAVKLANVSGAGGGLSVNQTFEVGPLTVTGASSTAGGSNGTVFVAAGSDLNGDDGQPVSVKYAGVFAQGRFGPLTLNATSVQNGYPTTGPGLNVAGNVRFYGNDDTTVFSLTPGSGSAPVANVDYPQLGASGSAVLGGHLTLYATCNQAVGTSYTLVRAGGGLSGYFLKNGSSAQIADKSVVPTFDYTNACDNGNQGPDVRIRYNKAAGTMTATVVDNPPGTTND